MQQELTGKPVASLIGPFANSPEGPCIGSDDPLPLLSHLWTISIADESERPIGYSALDDCTPIFLDRGGKHSDGYVARGTRMVVEGFYEKTAGGGHIEVNSTVLMQKTERYRAAVLCHEELHGVLEWLDPARLNQAILPMPLLAKARMQLRESGYESADVDDEILPRLLTHDPDGNGLSGVAEEDRVIRAAMSRLLTESEDDPELKAVYWQLQRAHAITHGVISGQVGIGALMCGRAQRLSNPQKLPTQTSHFRRFVRRAD